MHRWKEKDIKYDTVEFTFWIHFILVLISHRLQVSGFVGGLENLEIIWPHKLRLQRIFSQMRGIYLSDCFIYQIASFCLVYCVVLSTQQDLHRWPCSTMASLRPRNNDTVRGRWVKHLAGPASLLHEWHTVVLHSQSPCTQLSACNAICVPCTKLYSACFFNGKHILTS